MPALENVHATRYVMPLREGGSLPGLIEADDLGMYVAKFRGAGQGLKALVAEVIVGELARRLGMPVPRMVTVDLPFDLTRYEADEEVQDLLQASVGSNLGVDFLPAAFAYDGSHPPSAPLAAQILWLDALTANVDRTWNNPNLLRWHGQTYAIDHGAALWFHHLWPTKPADADRFAAQPFDATTHVLRGVVTDASVAAAHEELAVAVTDDMVADVVGAVPKDWLEPALGLPDPESVRAAYADHLVARLHAPGSWLPGGAP
ncbi:MAG: HipA family kinase [Nostocoides sp.]